MKGSWISDNIKSLLSLFLALTVEGYLYMITIIQNDTNIRTQATTAQIALAVAITSYYFGYSQGASKKDEAQAMLTANSQVVQTTTSPAPEVKQ